jgi:hypothetical protein
MKLIRLPIYGLLVLVGCGPTAPAATEADIAAAVFGSTENLSTMKSASTVTACRIKPASSEAPYDQSVSAETTLAAYKEGPWVDTSASQSDRIREILLAPDTYIFGVGKSCVPRYGVRIRFDNDGSSLDVNLCFECSALVVVRDGHIVRAAFFDGGERKLIALCKELFPNDPEIQALKP